MENNYDRSPAELKFRIPLLLLRTRFSPEETRNTKNTENIFVPLFLRGETVLESLNS
jgi:hypothetical protein